MTDTRSSSALFKRAEQLKRWEESDTNKQSALPKRASRIQFSSGIVFLAACTAGDKEEVQRLLKMGADINTANVDGLTALHQACIDDNLDMVEFLVSHGADVNRGDNEGWTALHATASCGFLSIARYLLENGADVGAVNYDGELAIDIAESDAMLELLQTAIDEKGVDCDKRRNAEVNTLMADARNWAANGYVEVRDPKTGGTPLHVAAAKGYIDVAQTLLEQCNVEPDCVDYEGWTPLHAAALFGQREAVALLLKAGADPHLKNYSGQTCLDLVDPSMSRWLADAVATLKATPIRVNNKYNINNNKRRASPPSRDVKRVELQITGQDTVINAAPSAPEIIPKLAERDRAGDKPPKGRAPSPEQPPHENNDDAPSWRRSASFRYRQDVTNTRDNNSKPTNNAEPTDNDTILRRTHSFENDKTFYQRYRDVTARIKASSCPSIPPLPHPAVAAAQTVDRVLPERREREATTTVTTQPTAATAVVTSTTPTSPTHTSPSQNSPTQTTPVRSVGETVASGTDTTSTTNSSNSTPSAATPTKLSPGNIFKNFFKSFVPPVRDEESETQRKAHAKRVRETRRSTQGVTLDEIKSAEQLVKKKAGNGTTETTPAPAPAAVPPAPTNAPAKKPDDAQVNDAGRGGAVTGGEATATATIAANAERRPSWRLRLDPTNKFELEDASSTPSRTSVTTVTTNATEATVTIPLRRPPSGSTANTTNASQPAANKEDARSERERVVSGASEDGERERESSVESKSSSPASTQAALNVIQRRRRPKRRSTGVGHVDMEDIVNERSATTDGDADAEIAQSGTERGDEAAEGEGERDYKALYEASASEVRRLRQLLATSEQQLREARATITKLTQVNQNSLSEIEKREKRAMERKLSEMEEELKYQQTLQAENQRLKDENGALIRVISKLSK